MATVGDGGLCRIPLTRWPPEVKKTPHLIMADWASLPPNLPTPSPMGPLTLVKGSPLEEGAWSPGCPEAALPTP